MVACVLVGGIIGGFFPGIALSIVGGAFLSVFSAWAYVRYTRADA